MSQAKSIAFRKKPFFVKQNKRLIMPVAAIAILIDSEQLPEESANPVKQS